MKKAYVKVKNKSAGSVLKRPYIAATIIGAAVCAIALSFKVKLPETGEINNKTTLSAASEVPKDAENTPAAPHSEEVPKQASVEARGAALPKSEAAGTNADAAAAPEKNEDVSVGMFGKADNINLIKPVDAEIIKAYSDTKPVKSKTLGDWRIHSGIDIKAEKGTEVKAAADGKVITAHEDSLTGHTISIDHGNGLVSTVYNLESSDKVSEGQEVKSGDIIGTAGASAAIEMLDDPHIHVELTKNGELVNPEEYMK